ncbi:MAG: winged helix-turn-helix domain-containing protein [Ilumatobacteraceae bacterium]|nr:winged helix-turn-helix domain-containing protein [Ilumatobacteraceae bacterium]
MPTTERPRQLSLAQARRLALGAQGFTDSRPTGRVDRRHLRRVVDRMGLIQIDSVNVLVRSQELPLYARLGTHPRSLIPDATADGELFEYWVHEASHVPVELHPYLRWHMNRDHRWGGVNRLFESRHGFVDEVLQRIDREGPIVAGDLKQRRGPKGTWWDWDDGKIALEYLFHRGQLAAVRRPNDFARVYDLADRVLPADVLAVPDVPEVEARKELLVRAARHHGVGTLEDLTDYHRQRNPPCRPLVPELVEDGRLVEAQVEGWDKPAYMHPDAVIPRRVEATALLSPFDPVVWNRDRTERLFGFRYRIEIYVPKAKRKYGYYVLPILIGDGLAGRVDLKADRAEGVLRVLGLFAEDHADRAAVRAAIEPELEAMSTWLGLDGGVEWRP